MVTTPVWETMVALPDSRAFVKVSDAFVERVKRCRVREEKGATDEVLEALDRAGCTNVEKRMGLLL